MAIAAVETRYAGCRFRSRLEARWAVFYDTLGIPWEYEPQGFDLDRLVRAARERLPESDDPNAWPWADRPPRLGLYLPDFWLPTQQIYIEVKGERPSGLALQRLWGFSLAVMTKLVEARQFVLCTGGIPRTGDWQWYGEEYAELYAPYWDNLWAWNRCRECGSYDMQFEGRAGRNYCGCGWGGDDGGDICSTIYEAFTAARSARFEFGETPRRGMA